VVDGPCAAAATQCLAQEGAAAATNLEQVVVGRQREFGQDDAEVGPVVEGVAVELACLRPRGAPGSAVEPPVAEAARARGAKERRGHLAHEPAGELTAAIVEQELPATGKRSTYTMGGANLNFVIEEGHERVRAIYATTANRSPASRRATTPITSGR
jgi:hypothetical protein